MITEENKEQPHERIFNLLFQEDELTWQNIIYDLINSEGMNPWDIDVSQISLRFLEKLKELKKTNFRISGKIVLASALLLKIKSDRLLHDDLTAFDNLMAASEEEAIDILEDFAHQESESGELPKLIPRVPQPRKRKVSVFDLVEALEKALEVESRRKQYIMPDAKVEPPKKTREITLVIKDIYEKIMSYFRSSTTRLTFDQLVPSDTKEDKVFTFVPLLHLDFQRRIDLRQKEHFGEISILMNKKNLK